LTGRHLDAEERIMRGKLIVVLTVVAGVCGGVAAENLTGADKILCAGLQATRCDTTGTCETGMPWRWNMPEFIEIHLDDQILSTTPAVERPRRTKIQNLTRSGGEIYLQGVENARAFSFVIDETSGVASIAIATDGMTISVFASCTPLRASSRKDTAS
jgi:hypothetical protein